MQLPKTIYIVCGTYIENTWEDEAKCDILGVFFDIKRAEIMVDEFINMPNCGEYDSVYLEAHFVQ